MKCPIHNAYKYNELWDAYFCDKCDIWLENQCEDKECCYCISRPEKPSVAESFIEEQLNLMNNCVVEYGGDARCITSDGRNVNMAEELNRIERKLIDRSSL